MRPVLRAAMMQKKPFEIARETLMLLAARKLTPTPVNYQAVYGEIAGTPDVATFPEMQLRKIAQALPLKAPEQRKHRDSLERAIAQHKWDDVQGALIAMATAASTGGRAATASTEAAGAAPGVGLLEMTARIIENAMPA